MDTKLNTAIDEINQFVSERISLLLNDLIVESNEYEETKKQILQIPFVKKIINNIIYNTIHNEDTVTEEDVYEKDKEEEENENILLNIDENDQSEELDNIVELDTEEDVVEEEERCVCCGGNRDMVNEKCLTCLEDCGVEDNQFEEDVQPEDLVEELNNIVEFVTENVEESDTEDEDEDEDEVVETIVEAEEEAEEEEVFEIEINGVNYFTTNEKSGIIYASDENSDPGDEVGIFQNGTPIFHS